jgi:hypothetical protein
MVWAEHPACGVDGFVQAPDATVASCPPRRESMTLPTIAVDINTALDPVDLPQEHYELTDRIAVLIADPFDEAQLGGARGPQTAVL